MNFCAFKRLRDKIFGLAVPMESNMKSRLMFSILCTAGLLGMSSCNDSTDGELDPNPNGECGNNVVESGELCDFVNGVAVVNPALAQSMCGTGVISSFTCSPSCDLSVKCSPQTCGDGVLDSDEQCDVIDGQPRLNPDQISCDAGDTLKSFICLSTCEAVLTCTPTDSTCGNGAWDAGEVCETIDGVVTLRDSAASLCPEGETLLSLTCTDDCTPAPVCTLAPGCGNGQIDDGETCDGSLLPEAIECPTGYEPKGREEWVCASCQIDVMSSCELQEPADTCGNGLLDDGEACDGNLFADDAGASCPDGYGAAELVCAANCAVDVAASCAPLCGNGQIDDGEACDLVGTLPQLGEGGSPSCGEHETLISWSCTNTCSVVPECDPAPYCGDGVIGEDEECDGSAFPESISCVDGSVPRIPKDWVCTSTCKIDLEASCAVKPESCDNGRVDPGEVCDNAVPELTPVSCMANVNDENYKNYYNGCTSYSTCNQMYYWGANSCSQLCTIESTCEAVAFSDLNLTTIADHILNSDCRTVDPETEKATTNAELLGKIGVTTTLSISWDETSGTYGVKFSSWGNVKPNGSLNTDKYMQYDLLHQLAPAPELSGHMSFFFTYKRTNTVQSPKKLAVLLYDGDAQVSVLGYVGTNTLNFRYAGPFVFPVDGLTHPYIRIVSADTSHSGPVVIKDLASAFVEKE